MTRFLPERRRSPPAEALPRIHRASATAFARLRARCDAAGLRRTPTRDRLMHILLCIEDEMTAMEIWRRSWKIAGEAALGRGALQRNLNLLTEAGILRRSTGPDRVWRYRLPETAPDKPVPVPSVTFLEAGTGRKASCDLPEIADFLHRVARERGLAIASVAIVLASG